MEKINFSDLNLELNKETKEIEFKGNKLEILKYLPSKDKYDVLMITLQEAYEDGVYNPFKIDMFFHLNLVLTYCESLKYSEEDTQNPLELYDKMKSNGLLDIIIDAIDDTEYAELWDFLNELIEIKTEKEMTLIGLFEKLSTTLPSLIEESKKIMDDFDPEKYKNVIDFAKYANGNRDIFTNQPVEENN